MWTPYEQLDTPLEGLVAAVAEVLQILDVDVDDERVSGVPTARVLRYYQSTGLIDRPIRYDGRRAIYGFRHLVQAVSVKLAQSEGFSLAQIQEALAGRSTEAMAQLIAGASGAAPAESAQQAPPAAAPVSMPMGRPVLQALLAPGVTVTIDPALVVEPSAVLAALAAALSPRGVK